MARTNGCLYLRLSIRRDLPGKGDSQSAAHDRLLWAVNTFGEVLGEVSLSANAVLCCAVLRLFSPVSAPQPASPSRRQPPCAAARCPTPCGQVFITPMPLLRLMEALGARNLRTLGEAVAVMRAAMLGVIQVGGAGLGSAEAGGEPGGLYAWGQCLQEKGP